jgi:hypothetical protein
LRIIGYALVDQHENVVASRATGLAVYRTIRAAKVARKHMVGKDYRLSKPERDLDQQRRAEAAFDIKPVHISE